MRLGPRPRQRLPPIGRTLQARHARPDHRLERHRVQMPPRPLRGQLVEGAVLAADRTLGLGPLGPSQLDRHALFPQFQFPVLDLPGRFTAQAQPIMPLQFVLPKNRRASLPTAAAADEHFQQPPPGAAPRQRSEVRREAVRPTHTGDDRLLPKHADHFLLKRSFPRRLSLRLPTKMSEAPIWMTLWDSRFA